MNLIFNVLFAGRGILGARKQINMAAVATAKGKIVIYCRCKSLYSAPIRHLGAVILTVVSLCRMYEVLGQCMNTKEASCFKQEVVSHIFLYSFDFFSLTNDDCFDVAAQVAAN